MQKTGFPRVPFPHSPWRLVGGTGEMLIASSTVPSLRDDHALSIHAEVRDLDLPVIYLLVRHGADRYLQH